MPDEFDKTYWEAQHAVRRSSHGDPSPHLIDAAKDLAAGKALDAGCGDGADAVWLAAHGWRVTAADISDGALARARERARDADVEVDWQRQDLTAWRPGEASFDLVTTHYVHTAGSREELFERLAAAVAPGGTLLIVGHDPSDTHSRAHASGPGVHFTADEVAASLDSAAWEVVVAEASSRTVSRSGGKQVEMRDTVLRAVRR